MARRVAVVQKTLPRAPCLDPDILRIELSVLFFFHYFMMLLSLKMRRAFVQTSTLVLKT